MTFAGVEAVLSFNGATVGYSTRQARTTVILGYEYFGVMIQITNSKINLVVLVHVVQTTVIVVPR